MSEFNPLVQRVDALLKRHQQQGTPVPHADPDTTLAMGAVADAPREAQAPLEAPVEAVSPAPAEAPLPVLEEDFPVLTEIVTAPPPPDGGEPDAALAAGVESAVLEKVLAGLDATLQDRMGRTVSDLLEQAMDGLRADLSAGMRELLREAVATALREELASRARRD